MILTQTVGLDSHIFLLEPSTKDMVVHYVSTDEDFVDLLILEKNSPFGR